MKCHTKLLTEKFSNICLGIKKVESFREHIEFLRISNPHSTKISTQPATMPTTYYFLVEVCTGSKFAEIETVRSGTDCIRVSAFL